jgi:hypothetical protein
MMMLSIVGRSSAHIVAIGALNRQTNGYPMPFREQAAFDPTLAAIGGIGARFFPT